MSLEDLRNEIYVVETPECSWCGKNGVVEVPAPGFFARQLGAAIQEAYPDLDVSLREQLMTGYHPECWTQMFGKH
jgi:hypothetical protein